MNSWWRVLWPEVTAVSKWWSQCIRWAGKFKRKDSEVPTSRIPHPTSHIPHPASRIPHPTSRIPHPHIPHPASRTPHPASRSLQPSMIMMFGANWRANLFFGVCALHIPPVWMSSSTVHIRCRRRFVVFFCCGTAGFFHESVSVFFGHFRKTTCFVLHKAAECGDGERFFSLRFCADNKAKVGLPNKPQTKLQATGPNRSVLGSKPRVVWTKELLVGSVGVTGATCHESVLKCQ